MIIITALKNRNTTFDIAQLRAAKDEVTVVDGDRKPIFLFDRHGNYAEVMAKPLKTPLLDLTVWGYLETMHQYNMGHRQYGKYVAADNNVSRLILEARRS